MNRERECSDEFLNAFIDGQVATEDTNHLYARMSQDEALARRVHELRTLRDLVQVAYKNTPAPVTRAELSKTSDRLRWRVAGSIAAGLVLALGLLGAWISRPPAPMQWLSASRTVPATAVNEEIVKVLFHVNTDDPARMKETLDEVEGVLKFYRQTNQHAQIEVIANGSGLSLLRVDTSPYPQRVQRMMKDYANLTFVACQNTMSRVEHEQGVTAHLLPGIVVIDSGVAQIMRRQQQGWAYIRS
jgi:intracellular sulfur oxidation DsrE/DsrF family protein